MMCGLFSRKVPFGRLGIDADWHCHILPGVDDGVRKFEESVSILRKMQKLGFKKVVLTPHINPDIFHDSSEAFLIKRYKDFRSQLPSDIVMELSLGAEYMIYGGFTDRKEYSNLLCLHDKYVLIEMSYYAISNNIKESIFGLCIAGYIPVLAHPERYTYLVDKLHFYDELRDMGCLFQLNLFSLSGVYGKASVRIMEYLISKGWYDYVGTDTHSLEHLVKISEMKVPRKANLVSTI